MNIRKCLHIADFDMLNAKIVTQAVYIGIGT